MSEVPETYNSILLNLVNGYATTFEQKPRLIKELFVEGSVIRQLSLEAYNITVRANEIEPIEMLSEEGNKKLWDESSEYSTDKEIREKWCKCVWLMMSVTA